MTEPCIACEVLAPILEARAAWLRRKIRPFIRSHEWLAAGLGLRLAYSPRVLGLVSELIQVEAESCPFLRFEMRTQAGTALLELDIIGPPGTRGFLEQMKLVTTRAGVSGG